MEILTREYRSSKTSQTQCNCITAKINLKIYLDYYKTILTKLSYNSFSVQFPYLIGRRAESLEKGEDNKGAYKKKGPCYSAFCEAE